MNRKSIFFLLVLAFGAACSVQKPAPLNNTWEQVSSKDGSEPVQRHEAGFVEAGGQFVLLGGRGIRPVSIFDPSTGVWREGSPPPIELHHFQAINVDNKVYIAGALTGRFPGETPVPNIYIYDPVRDQWSVGPDIPAARRRGAAGVVFYEGKIYMVCGIADGHRGEHRKWFDVYDPETGVWAVLPDAPRERDHFQATVVNDQLYLVGGRLSMAPEKGFSETIGEVDVFDFKTGTWTTLANPLPTPRAGSYNFAWGNEVIVLGGESAAQEAAHAEVEALDVRNHTWRRLSPMIEGRHGTGALVYEGAVYVASGSGNRGGGPELKTLEKLVLK
jgi:hypothetical protein